MDDSQLSIGLPSTPSKEELPGSDEPVRSPEQITENPVRGPEKAKKSTTRGKTQLDPLHKLKRGCLNKINENIDLAHDVPPARNGVVFGKGVGKGNQIRPKGSKRQQRQVHQRQDQENLQTDSTRQRDKKKTGRKRRIAPGTLALKEIRRLQRTTELQIPRACFQRLVRSIMHEIRRGHEEKLKFQTAALLALQEAAEAFIVRLMEDATLATIHAKRVTLFVRDLTLVRRILKEN